MISVGNFQIFYLDSKGKCCTDYIQALNAQQAADYAREYFNAVEVYNVYREIKNWK